MKAGPLGWIWPCCLRRLKISRLSDESKMDYMGDSMRVKQLCRLIDSNDGVTRDEVDASLRPIANKSRFHWRQESPLVTSVRKGRQDLVEHLIAVAKFDVNSRCNDPRNWCPLAAAIANNDFEMARLLVNRFKAGNC